MISKTKYWKSCFFHDHKLRRGVGKEEIFVMLRGAIVYNQQTFVLGPN
jgi:hypothetical protein